MKTIIDKNEIDRMVELANEYKELYYKIDELLAVSPWNTFAYLNASIQLRSEEAVRQLAHKLAEEVEQDSDHIYFKYKDVYIFCVKRGEE